jgi:hypothetical protein
MDEQANLILAYGPPPGGGGYGAPPGGGGYGPPPGGGGGYGGPPPGGGGYGGPPPGGFGGPPPGGGGYGGGGSPFGSPGPQMPPMGPGFAPQGSSNGLAIGALVTGILALPTTCCCSIASLPLGIAACVMGGIALSKIKAAPQIYGGKGMALAGAICGAISILVGIAFLALGMGQALVDQYTRTH